MRSRLEIIQERKATVRQKVVELLQDDQERRPIEIADKLEYNVTQVMQALTDLLELGQVSRSERIDQARSGHKGFIVLYRKRKNPL